MSTFPVSRHSHLQFVSVLPKSFLEENYVQKTKSYQCFIATRQFVAF
jgi:hypothetical protein